LTILALETSAKAASCAVVKNGGLFCEAFSDAGLQHSQTLVPMLKAMLESSAVALEEIDAFAVSAGPGSFTGVRIGVAAVKGLTLAKNAPCAGISSLEAMAYNVSMFKGLVLPVMDARRNEFYAALFRCSPLTNNKPERLTQDMAIGAEKLLETLEAYDEPVMLLGDGAELCLEKLGASLPLVLAPEHLRRQRASGVAAAALNLAQSEWQTAESLMPIYLRLSQAERERKNKAN
jgi:tRNA threonylcarbamoyladenosine biosynthesis protein TsaB